MSMIGLAASPGTDVDPICSIRSAAPPSAPAMILACASNCLGQFGSYSTIFISRFSTPPTSRVFSGSFAKTENLHKQLSTDYTVYMIALKIPGASAERKEDSAQGAKDGSQGHR